MNKTVLRLVVALGLTLAATPVLAATSFEPGIQWKTLESPHFRVNYPAELEALSRKVLAMAEDAHDKVAPYMRTTTYEKTDIVCFDTVDDTNANASNVQHNHINLNLHPPSPDEGMPIGRYDDWLRWVILHEYTHILHQNLTPWWIMEFNAAIGSIYFNNFPIAGIPSYIAQYIPSYFSDAPRFIMEGWAVTTETRFTPGGRAIEGDQDMKMRMATLGKRLYTIDQINGSYLLDWPSGGVEYDYGTLFFAYVMKAYGEDVPIKVNKALGRMPWLGIDNAVSSVLPGKDCNKLFDEMIAWLKVRYTRQAEEIRRYPITDSTRLTWTGRHHHHPKWLGNDELLYAGSLKGKGTGLFVQDAKGDPRPERLFGKDYSGDFCLSADGKTIYYSQQDEDRSRFTSYFDLYRYDVASHQSAPLTRGYRAWGPAISPKGDQLVCVVTRQGTNYLAQVDPQTGDEVRPLTSCSQDAHYSNPVWSPDGRRLAVSKWENGRNNLVEIDPATLAQTRLTTGNALDFYPSYTPDGQYLVFTSDRTGVFNQYALRLSDKAMFRLTNVMGGAVEGSVSPDGKTLAFSNYSEVGYDLHVMPFDPERGLKVDLAEVLVSDHDGRFLPRVPRPATPVDYSAALSATPRDYSPFPTLLPTTYLPLFAYDQTLGFVGGFAMSGQDALRQHFVNMYGLYTVGGERALSNQPSFGIAYQNDQLLPSLTVYGMVGPTADLYVWPPWVSSETRLAQLWQREYRLELSARVPGIPMPLLGSSWVNGDSWQFGVRTVYDQPFAALYFNKAMTAKEGILTIGDGQDVAPANVFPQETASTPGLNHSLFVNYQFADNAKPGYAISPESGSIGSVGYEQGIPYLGGQSLYERFWTDYRRYLAMPWSHHVLALRGAAGLSFSQNGGQFTMGDLTYQNMLNQIDLTAATDVSTSRFNVRGYNSSFFTNYGNKAAFLSAEYRFPLLEVGRGWGTLPIYLDQFYSVVGLDVGNVWDLPFLGDRTFKLYNTMVGASVELRAQVVLLRYLRTNLRLGVARGLTDSEYLYPDTKFILGFGNSF